MADPTINITERVKVKSLAKRGVYDFDKIAAILDDTFICHIGFIDKEQPYVIPTCFGRKDDKIFFHGAKGSRMLKTIKAGGSICVTVTHLDGIVLARSAFHHSVNYRSVVILGIAKEITDSVEKNKALEFITEHILAGRWNDVRKPSEKELNATSVFSLYIKEASAKIREGLPVDDEEDLELNVWAGVIPVKTLHEAPFADPCLKADVKIPSYISNLKADKGI